MRFPLLFTLMISGACATAGMDPGMGDPDAFPGRADADLTDAGPTPDGPASACALALSSLTFDFESGADGFTHDRSEEVAGETVSWRFDHWERGSADVSCASGNNCFGTNLVGNYIQCQRAYLQSPPIDLSDCAGESVQLLFEHNYDFWTGDYNSTTWFDGGVIEISKDGGVSWAPASLTTSGTVRINPDRGATYACVQKNNFYVHQKAGFVGSSGGWVSETVDLPADYLTDQFQIRFSYASGVSSETTSQEASKAGTRPGWYVDNFRFE